MDKTKSERSQLQENIDSMELELRQVQEEIAEVTRQNENVSGKCLCSRFCQNLDDPYLAQKTHNNHLFEYS